MKMNDAPIEGDDELEDDVPEDDLTDWGMGQ